MALLPWYIHVTHITYRRFTPVLVPGWANPLWTSPIIGAQAPTHPVLADLRFNIQWGGPDASGTISNPIPPSKRLRSLYSKRGTRVGGYLRISYACARARTRPRAHNNSPRNPGPLVPPFEYRRFGRCIS